MDYVFHVGNYNTIIGSEVFPSTTLTNDYFSIHDYGYRGMGKLNGGSSLVEVSDVNSIGITGVPLLEVDNGTPADPYFMVRGSSTGVNVGIGVDPLAGGANSTLALQGVGGTALTILTPLGGGGSGIFFADASSATEHII